jgi:cyclophilin family peptidyl-prolyl cis-trans isomerase
MKNFLFILLFLLTYGFCTATELNPNKPVYVEIATTMGKVTVELYDDTPLHRDNFIKLCQSGEYKGMIFHRIIKDFVVQGGDPTSKARIPGFFYGDGDGGFTVPAEILPNHFNKRGALIDAKEIDAVNPQRASAGTQFCFVQGKKLTDEELNQKEVRINEIRKNWLFYKFQSRLIKENPSFADASHKMELENKANAMVKDTLATLGKYRIPADQREYYKTIGGVPHLDGSVTIFGEVVKGFDIVKKMSLVETDMNDRPINDVIILSTKVFQK